MEVDKRKFGKRNFVGYQGYCFDFCDKHQNELIFISYCVLHPVEYARVLMQLGYEPIPPQESTTFYGSPIMRLPSYFGYIQFIKQSDGLLGCYRGLLPRMLGVLASSFLSMEVIQRSGMNLPEIRDPPNIATDGEPNPDNYIKIGRRIMILHAVGTIVSYPFNLVGIRMMASFIGKEEQYSTLLGAIASVYQEDGILGFYQGIIPHLLGDMTSVALTCVLAYYANKHLIKVKEYRKFTIPAFAIATGSIAYQMEVVSACMAVTGTSLKAGNPPNMPKYPSWPTCWLHLFRNKQLARGSSMMFRYYTGPLSDLDI